MPFSFHPSVSLSGFTAFLEKFSENALFESPAAETSIAPFFENKTILITGAGGSIGCEICRKIAQFKPNKLILVENNEYFLWKIRVALSEQFPDLEIVSCLADVTARPRMQQIFSDYRPKIVFHAAALKHIKIVEENPCEGFLINIIGTKILSELAITHGVENFIFLSTDKAVKPVSRMGASKRIAELWLQRLGAKSAGKTSFAMLRFGNVLGSAGSVFPLFEHQISQGGPITLTHKAAERYFITSQQAVSALLEAAFLSAASPHPGALFSLEMGRPVHILDLAQYFIEKAERESGKKIEIHLTGLEKGEKLQEDLLYEDEKRVPVAGYCVFRIFVPEDFQYPEQFEEKISQIEKMCRESDQEQLLNYLPEILPNFSWR